MNDHELAAHLAGEAGRMLMGVRASRRHDGADLGRAGDREANALLVAAIRELRPEDGLLSEDVKDDPARLSKSRCWIIDPLDGTREYSEGRSDWAVHVALAVDGVPTVGAVALPALGAILRTDELLTPPTAPGRPRMVVSRTRPGADSAKVAKALDAELIPMGSAGAKAMAVVRGEAEIYLHSGGQYEWDNCAPAAVALAHGLHASRADGSALVYNRPDPLLPDLLICRPEWTERVLGAL